MKLYPQAYIEYLMYFHGPRDYFECHEVMEEYWKNHLEDSLHEVFVGMIQIAVGLYHERRKNIAGAIKMLKSAKKKLDTPLIQQLALDHQQLMSLLAQRIQELHHQEMTNKQTHFVDLNLPLIDDDLIQKCQAMCEMQGWVWKQPSNMQHRFLIEKHQLRDRTEVIEERNRQLQLKSKSDD
jgi:predicted metal-dependent hydrolase